MSVSIETDIVRRAVPHADRHPESLSGRGLIVDRPFRCLRLAKVWPAVLIGAWVALLVAGFTVAGRTGLGTLLTAAFILQVMPSIWTAYRTARPSGVSRGTWMLILSELSCWTIFGVHKADPRLITLGFTRVTASLLMLTRIRRTSEKRTVKSAPCAI